MEGDQLSFKCTPPSPCARSRSWSCPEPPGTALAMRRWAPQDAPGSISPFSTCLFSATGTKFASSQHCGYSGYFHARLQVTSAVHEAPRAPLPGISSLPHGPSNAAGTTGQRCSAPALPLTRHTAWVCARPLETSLCLGLFGLPLQCLLHRSVPTGGDQYCRRVPMGCARDPAGVGRSPCLSQVLPGAILMGLGVLVS